MRILATSPPIGRVLRGVFLLSWMALATGSPAATGGFAWQVEVTPAGALFPAFELSQKPQPSTRAAGDGSGLVRVLLHGTALPRRIVLTLDTPGLRSSARLSVAPAPGARMLELRPRLVWDMDLVARLHAPRAQVLEVRLEGDGFVQRREVPVQVHPLEDALYYVRDSGHGLDLGWAFAGYVEPTDPAIDALLALARTLESAFDRDRDASGDRRRVAAIWAALERHGLRYDDGDPALSRGPAAWSQRVRRPTTSWREARASCIDASVLIASALERLGIAVAIVLVPGHAFLGYRPGGASTEYLETTLLGRGAGFRHARAAGEARWQAARGPLARRKSPDYAVIDVGQARAYGIIPLGDAAHLR